MSDSTENNRGKSPIGAILVFGSAIALTAILVVGYSRRNQEVARAKPKIARYGMIQKFDLIDHKNQPFTMDNVEGKVWVANFIFTSCATECPLLSRRMQDVQTRFTNDPRVELVSISVDPRTDNPARLAKYAKSFKAGDKWSFLTGDTKEIETLSVKGFMIAAAGEEPEASSIRRTRQLLHSEKIAVVDQLGVVRFFANGMNPKAAVDVIEVVNTLLAAGE